MGLSDRQWWALKKMDDAIVNMIICCKADVEPEMRRTLTELIIARIEFRLSFPLILDPVERGI